MASKKGGLGKGLDAIFAENDTEDRNAAIALKTSEIEPNREQPRKDFDEKALSELADSISQHGVLQPLLLRPMLSGGYRIVAGERRWRAARMAGLCMIDTLYRSQPDLTGRDLKAFLLTAIHSSRPPNIILNFIKGFFLCGKSLKLTDEKYLREISPLQTFGL